VSPRLSSPDTSWFPASTLYAAPRASRISNALSTCANDDASASWVRSPRCAMNTMLSVPPPLFSIT
jgi:hypothetical protein